MFVNTIQYFFFSLYHAEIHICSQEAGRLLFLGQNEWAHVNCCLWSAEVFEEDNGSLLHVHSAVTRGRLMVGLLIYNKERRESELKKSRRFLGFFVFDCCIFV